MEERRSSQVSFGASADLVKESALLALLSQSADCFFLFFGGGEGVWLLSFIWVSSLIFLG